MFGLGYGELLVVGFVALLLFGSRVPDVMRSLGRGMREFKDGVNGVKQEISQIEESSTVSSSASS